VSLSFLSTQQKLQQEASSLKLSKKELEKRERLRQEEFKRELEKVKKLKLVCVLC